MSSKIATKEKIQKVKEVKDRIKNFHQGIWLLLFFLIPLVPIFYFSRYIDYGSFTLGANVNYATEMHYFSVSWNYFLQILLLGPILGILFFILMKKFVGKIDGQVRKNQKIVIIIEICVVTLVILNSLGHFSHLGFEIANAIDPTAGHALSSEYKEIFVYAWFMDEWFGHTLINLTYFGYLVVAVWAEQLLNEDKRMTADEVGLVIVFSLIYLIIDGHAAIEGECGLILAILHLFSTFIAIGFLVVKKKKLLMYPVLLTLLISSIFILLYNLGWIIKYGWVSAYPFYSGNLS